MPEDGEGCNPVGGVGMGMMDRKGGSTGFQISRKLFASPGARKA